MRSGSRGKSKLGWMWAAAVLLGLFPASAAVAAGPEAGLDNRAWEMVSPVEQGTGQIGTPQDPGAASFQAAADGEQIVFGSAASFAGGVGAPPVSQYLATRGVGGWTTTNLSPPLLSGTYPGGAYQLFAADLSRSLLSNGWRCRDGGSGCPAENPPLAAGALPGYRTLYLRQGAVYNSLLTAANAPALTIAPEDFELSLEGATPDLRHAVISTCAALTADATEVPLPPGCDPAAANLYRWSEGTLTAVNLLPGGTETVPGSALAAPAGAISADGSRIYWSDGGDLYLRDGSTTKLVAAGAGFQAASESGSLAFYLAAGHLYRYDSVAETSTDLTPGGGAQGVLGVSASGSHVYYLTTAGLFLRQGGGPPIEVAAGADPSNLPAATGTARVSADGTRLAFVSSASLTGYPNAGKAEVYLYEAPADRLLCVSCNPGGTPPLGPSGLPPARAAAEGPAAYKPRALSADGTRLFFDSEDRLVAADTDGVADVYEWEAAGTGTCTVAAGCLGMVSFGRTGTDTFLDASADGGDAFFLTEASLVDGDHGGLDVYDARAGGGFPVPPSPPACEGDTCQPIVLPPFDPSPGTETTVGAPNPYPRIVKPGKKKRHHKRKHNGRRGGQRR